MEVFMFGFLKKKKKKQEVKIDDSSKFNERAEEFSEDNVKNDFITENLNKDFITNDLEEIDEDTPDGIKEMTPFLNDENDEVSDDEFLKDIPDSDLDEDLDENLDEDLDENLDENLNENEKVSDDEFLKDITDSDLDEDSDEDSDEDFGESSDEDLEQDFGESSDENLEEESKIIDNLFDDILNSDDDEKDTDKELDENSSGLSDEDNEKDYEKESDEYHEKESFDLTTPIFDKDDNVAIEFASMDTYDLSKYKKINCNVEGTTVNIHCNENYVFDGAVKFFVIFDNKLTESLVLESISQNALEKGRYDGFDAKLNLVDDNLSNIDCYKRFNYCYAKDNILVIQLVIKMRG